MIHWGSLIRPQGFLKIFQVCLGLSCLFLWRFGGPDLSPLVVGESDKVYLVIVTFAAFPMVSLALILTHLCDDDLPKSTLECMMGMAGFVMFLSSGGVVLELVSHVHTAGNDYTFRAYMLGILAVIAAIVHAIDAIFAFKNRNITWWSYRSTSKAMRR